MKDTSNLLLTTKKSHTCNKTCIYFLPTVQLHQDEMYHQCTKFLLHSCGHTCDVSVAEMPGFIQAFPPSIFLSRGIVEKKDLVF